MATFRRRHSRKYKRRNTRIIIRRKNHNARKSRINRRGRKSLRGGTVKAQVTKNEMLVIINEEVNAAVDNVVKAAVAAQEVSQQVVNEVISAAARAKVNDMIMHDDHDETVITRKDMLINVKNAVTKAVNAVMTAAVTADARAHVTVAQAAERAAMVEVAKATKKVDTEEEWLQLESDEPSKNDEKEWKAKDKSKMDTIIANMPDDKARSAAVARRRRWLNRRDRGGIAG